MKMRNLTFLRAIIFREKKPLMQGRITLSVNTTVGGLFLLIKKSMGQISPRGFFRRLQTEEKVTRGVCRQTGE